MSQEPSYATLCDKLELNFSLRNIPKLDLLSPSDPFIVVYLKDEVKNVYNVVGKTEIVWDNPHPDFSKDIRINYLFEEIQYIRLEMYDADEHQTIDLSKHDYIGSAEFVVGDLVTANGQKLIMAITDRNGKRIKKVKGLQPIVIVRAQEIDDNYDEIELQFSSNGLPKMDTFGKIDPFIQIYRSTNDGQWASVYKSEYIKSSYSPNWKQFTIQTRRLCDGDVEKPILIKIYDWNKDALPVFTCELLTTLAQLLEAKSIQFDCKDCGQLLIRHAKILKKYPFVNYLKGGLEMHFMTAIDFTGSNGDPNDAKSLHYMGPPQFESEYMKVIKSVGSVLAPYDAEGHIHAYGFGANLNPIGNKQISHCFNLTLTDENEVKGINGVLETYKKSLAKIQLYGPTYFNEIISIAAKSAAEMVNNEKEQNYIILLIIADGVVNDMQKTIDRIVEATELPLSVVIVGVGDADFSAMIRLDANDEPLKSSKGVVMKRDIVQFVEFNKFKNKGLSDLAKEVLEEIPDQVIEYMKIKNLSPLRKNNITPIGEENKRKYTPGGNDDCKNDETYFEPPNKKQKLISNNSNNSVL
eukprot:48639_1